MPSFPLKPWCLAAVGAGGLAATAATSGEPAPSGADRDPPASPLSDHWAYQPVSRREVPTVNSTTWPRNDVDRFILAPLEAAGIAPPPDAETAALCRRLYFDLTGLPPSVADLDEFERAAADDAAAAVAALADRLLASPRFGEHWARHWFDVARFAESVTLRGFIFREAWRYRDYVIEAFNRDEPFDQFVREQVAGDLLPHTTVEQHQRQVVATTFLALGNTNLEEQDKKQLDMDIVDEQLDTIGKAFLAQTIGCARCHDHKFDPIPTSDYYAMAGILRNVQTVKHANVSEWLEVPLPLPADRERELAAHEAAIAALELEILTARKLADAAADTAGAASTRTVVAAGSLPGSVVDSAQARAVGEWKHSQHSRHYIGDGYWHDDNAGKGTKTLTFQPELTQPGWYEVRLAYSHGPSRATNVPVTIFHADGESSTAVNQQDPPGIETRFVSLGRFRFEANGFASVLVATEGTGGHVTADAVQFLPAATPGTGAAATAPPVDEGDRASDLKGLTMKLEAMKRDGPARPKVMSVIERSTIEDSPVHVRGSVHSLGPAVPRGFLAVAMRSAAPAMPATESGRRELAAWIAQAENPLTARVFVNRIWGWLIGTGLVRSVDNFGTTGDPPSHPALLDHLALEFIRQGWSTKKLVREIVLSHTYQTSSPLAWWERATGSDTLTSTGARLTAEQLRDAMLAVSGELVLDPPHGPTFPAGRSADFGFVFTDPRRSVHMPVFRNALPPIFEAFDFPSPSLVTGRRSSSTVPSQALFLMNDPFVRERAEAAARRLLDEPLADDPARVERAYRRALGRRPTGAERDLGLRHTTASSDPLAAWTDVFHSLFASIEFRYLN